MASPYFLELRGWNKMNKEIKNKNIKVRMTQKQYDELINYCEYRGLTVSSAIRLAIEKLINYDCTGQFD